MRIHVFIEPTTAGTHKFNNYKGCPNTFVNLVFVWQTFIDVKHWLKKAEQIVGTEKSQSLIIII